MNIGSEAVTLGTFVEAVAAASGTTIRRTPYLHHSGILARALFDRSPLLRRSLPSINSALTYHLKESAYALDAAEKWLGPLPRLPLDVAIAATLASYGLMPRS